MKDIIFHVPDNTAAVNLLILQDFGQPVGWTLNTALYDLRGGKTEFTPDYQTLKQDIERKDGQDGK